MAKCVETPFYFTVFIDCNGDPWSDYYLEHRRKLAEEKEDYEFAALCRDEIRRRKIREIINKMLISAPEGCKIGGVVSDSNPNQLFVDNEEKIINHRDNVPNFRCDGSHIWDQNKK